MKIETLENGTKLKVTKDIYYVGRFDEFLTHDELMAGIDRILVKDNEYEVVDHEFEGVSEKLLLCTLGHFEGDFQFGQFDVNDLFAKGAFEVKK
jgi:hypothetical protein